MSKCPDIFFVAFYYGTQWNGVWTECLKAFNRVYTVYVVHNRLYEKCGKKMCGCDKKKYCTCAQCMFVQRFVTHLVHIFCWKRFQQTEITTTILIFLFSRWIVKMIVKRHGDVFRVKKEEGNRISCVYTRIYELKELLLYKLEGTHSVLPYTNCTDVRTFFFSI